MDSPLLVDIELDVGIMSVDSPPLVEDSHAFARTPLVDVARERMSALWENRTSVKAFLKTEGTHIRKQPGNNLERFPNYIKQVFISNNHKNHKHLKQP